MMMMMMMIYELYLIGGCLVTNRSFDPVYRQPKVIDSGDQNEYF